MGKKLVDPVTGNPSDKENAILISTFNSRQKVDPLTGKPSDAPDAIKRSAFEKRKKVDPNTGEPSDAPDAISISNFKSRQKVDPLTGKPSDAKNAITRTTFYSRQKVDPNTGEPSDAPDAISISNFKSRKKVDPNTGEPSDAENAVTRSVFYSKRKVDPVTRVLSNASNAITSGAFEKRKKVDAITGEPSNAENAITRSLFKQKQKVDPNTGEPSNVENAVARSVFYARQKVDPFTGEPSDAKNAITKNAFYDRKKVDPVTGKPSDAENAITRAAFKNNKKVDPNTGEPSDAENAITRAAFRTKKSRAKKNKTLPDIVNQQAESEPPYKKIKPNPKQKKREREDEEELPETSSKKIKQEPGDSQVISTHHPVYKVARINERIIIKIEDEDTSEDNVSTSSLTLIPPTNQAILDLTRDEKLGNINEIILPDIDLTSKRFDVNKDEDIQELIKVDKLVAYLSQGAIPTPPVEIKNIYKLNAKGVFASSDITNLTTPLGDYLGEKNEYADSHYIFSTLTGSIDALHQRNWTAYMNHSSNPNVRIEELEDGTIRFYPLRVIKTGEQLTINYGDEYFKYVNYDQLYLYKNDDHVSDSEKFNKNKDAYHSDIIRWTDPDLKVLMGDGCYIVPKLFHAILNNDINLVKTLLTTSQADVCAYAINLTLNGFEIEPPAKQEYLTPLMLAAHYGRVEIIKLLIEAGADFNRQMFLSGHNALSIIANSNYPKKELADFIVNQHADKIETFYYLVKEKTNILNFLLETPKSDQTINVIKKLLNPEVEVERENLKISLRKASNTLNADLIKNPNTDSEMIDLVWSKLEGQRNKAFNQVKSAYQSRKKVVENNKNFFFATGIFSREKNKKHTIARKINCG